MSPNPQHAQAAYELLQRLRGPALHCLAALLVAHVLQEATVVAASDVRRATTYSQDAVSEGLLRLRDCGLAEEVGRYGWRLSAYAHQMMLPFGPALTSAATPLLAESGVVGLKESNLINSFKTTTTPATPLLAESTPADREHAAAVGRALLRNAIAPHAGAQPLPADLVAVVELLVELNLPRKAAELAVAASPWPADKQREQIEIWQAYRRSKFAKGLNPGLFPQLVAARLSTGDECPHDTRGEVDPADPNRFDGYLNPDA